jgi:hypothetical protein
MSRLSLAETQDSSRVLKSAKMAKDTRLSVRVRSELKKAMEAIAAKESRSVAQICEAFLEAGSEGYRKEGSKYLQRFLSRRKEGPT